MHTFRRAVPDIYVARRLSLCLHSSNCFHLSGFIAVTGKIKKAQRERGRQWERKREHPVSESLPKNNAVCLQLRLSAADIMSCVTPAKARNCCSQYLAACISLSLSRREWSTRGLEESCGLFSDTIHIHMDLLSGSSRSLLARLALFMKPSITHI